MKYRVILADPAWSFSDRLTMSDVKRGAEAHYNTMTYEDIKNLPVKDVAADDSVLLLWVPSSLLSEGLETMKAWGFKQTQTHIWVKTKKNPLKGLLKEVLKHLKKAPEDGFITSLNNAMSSFSIENVLAFGMGRLFRQTHEILLVGVRGKIYKYRENKSQRSVHFFPATKHSVKPENLHRMLEKMFPNSNKLELFARRKVQGWLCLGNEIEETLGEDIRDSLIRLINENPTS